MVAMDERRLRELVAAKQKAWAASENEPQEPTEAEEAGNKSLQCHPPADGQSREGTKKTNHLYLGRGEKAK